jgi:hypothetical protein
MRNPSIGRPFGRREDAQSLVEFALTLPFFMMLMMVAVQLSLLTMAQLAVIWLATDNVRHAATSTAGVGDNWSVADSCQTTYRNSKLPSILTAANFSTFSFNPPYTPTTTNCANASLNVPQPGAVTPPRVRGGGLRLTIQYNPTNLIFLPTAFFGIPIRTTLPSYTAAAMME